MAMYMLVVAGATQVKTMPGSICGMFVSSTTAAAVTIYDTHNGNTSDPKVIDTFTPVALGNYQFPTPIYTNKGIYIVVTGGAIEMTFIYE